MTRSSDRFRGSAEGTFVSTAYLLYVAGPLLVSAVTNRISFAQETT
ncbi:hypothetical protein ACVIHH_007973 [Bradyrhizobium sp. USDA 4518]